MQIWKDEGKRAYLLLADGTVYKGISIGQEGTTIGEVVFTTGMTGYEETLTDPSYYGQIVTQTFPLIGNYGVNREDVESAKSHVRGYIIRELCDTPSNFRSENTLDWFLKEQKIVGICNLDTRALTRKIREQGVMNGMITTEDVEIDKECRLALLRDFTIRDAVARVSISAEKVYAYDDAKYRVALFDFGYKRDIRSSLLARGCEVTVLPANSSVARVLEGDFDSVILSDGPGDPTENTAVIETLQALAKTDLPIFGICLGHQLMALAQGAKTVKLKYGHRGANQPVIDLESGRTYVTHQNHGYEVLGDTLPAAVGKISHVNANDRGCEGICYADGKIFTVQFHPEACGTPTDTSALFDRFITLMDQKKGGC